MFEWFLNLPLILVEFNIKIEKIHVLTDFHFVFFTHDNFFYLQFICCMFCTDLWETLNIMKSIFDECKESARTANYEGE